MGIFGNKKLLYPDFSQLGVDLHSHVLPGMDDGSPSLGESVKMLKAMVAAGFSRIITTPHVISALYPNTKEQILGQLYHLREVVFTEDIKIEVEASAEYQIDYEFLGKVRKGGVIPFGKNKYLLIELPFMEPSFSCDEILYQVQLLGYEPVIAHPERYAWLMDNKKHYEGLKNRGMLFQLNLNSLNGLYGYPAKLAAHQLIDAGMIEFTGSDAHHSGHVLELQKVLYNKHFAKLVESNNLRNSSL
jgi:protein-tyrosine phosphatase